MIKVKIADLINGTDALRKLSEKDFKAKTAWAIARLLKAAEVEIQSFNETRMELIKKYGEKDENGKLITDENNNCKILPASIEAFSNELNELIMTEVEINANKIDFATLENTELTPSDITILEPFIDMDEEE